jgi:tetratricopeptide (TPR) repeat protein
MVPEDFAELVLYVRTLTADGRPDADPLWDRIRARTAEPGYVHDEAALGPEQVLTAELAEHAGFEGLDREQWARARAELLRAAALYEAAGLPGRAVTARARAAIAVIAAADPSAPAHPADATEPADGAGPTDGAAASGLPAPAAARAELDAELRLAADLLADERIEPDRYLAVLQCEAMTRRHQVIDELPAPGEAARAAFDAAVARLVEEATRLDVPARASAARLYAADTAMRLGDFRTAEAESAEALRLVEDAGQVWRTPRTLVLLAQLRLRGGAPGEAVALLHRALSAATRWPDRSLQLGPLHALLGHAYGREGDTAGAVRHLSEAADRMDRDGADQSAAQVRVELADLLTAEGRPADAVAVLESVTLGDTAGIDRRLLAQIRLDLGRGLAALGELREAAAEFVALADTVADWEDDRGTHTMVACEAAVALARSGQQAAARGAYERAVASHARGPRPAPLAGMMREFARLAMEAEDAEGLPGALRHLAEADRLCADVPPGTPDFAHWYHTGANAYQRGRAYAAADAYDEALAAMEQAIEAYTEGGRAGEEPRAEAVRIAALIEGNALGDVPAATARLAAAIERCTAAELPEAAEALASVRDGLAAQRQPVEDGG